MAFSYTPTDAITIVSKYVKEIPFGTISAEVVDAISSKMWTAYPWHWTTAQISPSIVVQNNVQDYSAPNFIYRLLRARIAQYNTTPVQYRELDVLEYLSPELMQGSMESIRAISLEEALGQLRLSYSGLVGVPNTTLSITSSTNVAPIVLLIPNHGFSNNTMSSVRVQGHLVNTAANGIWNITVPDSSHISLTGSTGNGVGGATGDVVNAMIRVDGEFQLTPTKIDNTNLATPFWFPDHYFPVMVEGLQWKIYQLADDPRAGTVTMAGNGLRQYTGQLSIYMDALRSMMNAEDRSSGQAQQFPAEGLGVGRSRNPGLY